MAGDAPGPSPNARLVVVIPRRLRSAGAGLHPGADLPAHREVAWAGQVGRRVRGAGEAARGVIALYGHHDRTFDPLAPAVDRRVDEPVLHVGALVRAGVACAGEDRGGRLLRR